MPLDAGDAGYGAAPGPKLPAGVGLSESAPLLAPEPEAQPAHRWKPLTTEELQVAAGGPGWRRTRCFLLAGFWLAWVAMLAVAVVVVVTSPRPAVRSLTWWQKALFYQVQPDLVTVKEDGSGGFSALREQLSYFRALGAGALILEGMFADRLSPFHLTPTAELSTRVAHVQHLLTESARMGLKVVLDICDANVTGNADESSNRSTSDALLFWLERGAAGFAICDTDAAYSEKTLLEWRRVLKKFSAEVERILVVKQKAPLRPLLNATLVDVLVTSVLPPPPQRLSAAELSNAVVERLRAKDEGIWVGWTVGGKVPPDWEKLLLVLVMTLPGSPAVQYEDVAQIQGVHIRSSHETNGTGSTLDQAKRSALALVTSLGNHRSREAALLFGSFFLLPSNSSSNSTPARAPPVLAFVRSWGCVHFLVLLNLGSEPGAMDPAWALRLPDTGVFVASTEMDRLGPATLNELHLRPHEAAVIKLLEAGSYS